MGFFDKIKSGLQRAMLVSQCAIAGVNLSKAEDGNSEEQFKYGKALLVGKAPLKQDKETAAEWLRKAAEQGYDKAQKLLGDCLLNGDGVAADAAAAVEWYRKAAEAGYRDAQKKVAECYANGTGVTEDKAKAYHYYELAAQGGCTDSMQILVDWCLSGIGTEKSEAAAFVWIEKLAGTGDVSFQIRAADALEQGVGVEIDLARTAKWLRKAADQGDASAQYRLAMALTEGRGVAQDDAEAFEYFRKAAKQNVAEAQTELAKSLIGGRGTERDEAKGVGWYFKALKNGNEPAKAYFDEQFAAWGKREAAEFADTPSCWFAPCELLAEQGSADAQYCMARFFETKTAGTGKSNGREGKIFGWDEKSAAQGHRLAQYKLAIHFREGKGTDEDYAAARDWLEKSAMQEYCPAMLLLGTMLRDGDHIPAEPERGFEWLAKAAEKGDVDSQREVADCFFWGIGTVKDQATAVSFYEKAANAGDIYSIKKMAECRRDGTGIEKSLPAMVGWYQKAAEADDGDSMLILGGCHMAGTGVDADPTAAAGWYEKAANHGVIPAMVKFGNCLHHGIGVEQNLDAAAPWYVKALEAASPDVKPFLDEITGEWTTRLPEEFKSVTKPVSDLFKAYAKAGDSDAQYCYGACFKAGSEELEQDEDDAGEWFEKAGAQGHVLAQFFAGKWREAEEDYAEAAEWFGKASNQGYGDAYFRAGFNYYRTNGDNDAAKHPEWAPNIVKNMERALETGVNFAAYFLGECYAQGTGCEANAEKSFEMYHILCTAESIECPQEYANEVEGRLTEAQYRLAEDYAEGKGTEQDPKAAINWYQTAAKRGHVGAEFGYAMTVATTAQKEVVSAIFNMFGATPESDHFLDTEPEEVKLVPEESTPANPKRSARKTAAAKAEAKTASTKSASKAATAKAATEKGASEKTTTAKRASEKITTRKGRQTSNKIMPQE